MRAAASLSFDDLAAGGVGLVSDGKVDGFLGRDSKLLERHHHLLGNAVLHLLGAVDAVEAQVLRLCLLVLVPTAYHEAAFNEELLELGEGIVGGPRLPLRRFVFEVFASVLLDGAEPLCHQLRLTCFDAMHAHEVLDVLRALL